MVENSNLARDHLANERTFLAWVRTSVAVVVFGFAIGRFAIAMRQLTEFQGHGSKNDWVFGVDGDECDSGGRGNDGGGTGALSKNSGATG